MFCINVFNDILTIWSNKDYIVWMFLFFEPLVILLSLKYIFYSHKKYGIGFAVIGIEDVVFIFLIISSILFFTLDFVFHHISSFFAIVDYLDIRCTILRRDIIKYFFGLYVVAGGIFCIWCCFFAKKHNLCVVKWSIYGLLYNIFAFIVQVVLIKKLGRPE